MRKSMTLAAAAGVTAAALVGLAPSASAAAPSNTAQFCKTSGIVGPFLDPNAFFANQGACASSLAQGPILQTPFGPVPSVLTRAGYVSRCKQIVSTFNLTYPFSTPDGEFTNIGNLKQCADRLQQLHDEAAGG